jgi:hypothetical protein
MESATPNGSAADLDAKEDEMNLLERELLRMKRGKAILQILGAKNIDLFHDSPQKDVEAA